MLDPVLEPDDLTPGEEWDLALFFELRAGCKDDERIPHEAIRAHLKASGIEDEYRVLLPVIRLMDSEWMTLIAERRKEQVAAAKPK